MNNFFKKLKVLILSILFNVFLINIALADQLKEIIITGNERLAKETIILFSKLSLNDQIDSNTINNTFKTLFSTNYFKDLKINYKSGILEIIVEENPIIQEIKIEGVKNKSILRELEKITRKTEKYPFIESNIINQKNQLNNIVRLNGFYFSKITTEIVDNNDNSVNLYYNFNLGDRAKINTINFVGSKIFKTRKLRKIILSEETKPWKFITKNKFLNPNRITTDINLLKSFYKNRGYFDVKVKSSYATLDNNKNFNLIFTIDAGEKFFFNNFNLNISDSYTSENFTELEKLFKKFKGDHYSTKSVNIIKDEIDKIALQKEFVFIDVKYSENIIDENKVDISFILDELDKSYVDRINIFGNFITEEKVIRNSMIVDEGDPYNKILFDKSIANVKSKGIFKSVNSQILDNSNKNKIINITVEEKPTGEIFAGVGTGTGGSSFSAGIKEKNYLGKGITLDTNFSLSDDVIRGKFQVMNPNFRNTDRSLNTTIESTASDFMSSSGYKTTRTGLSLGTGFEQFQDVFINFDISNYYEKLTTSDKATEIKKKQEGDYIENLFLYSVTLNKLNQNFQPTDGFFTKFSQSIPIYSDDNSFENSLTASKYYSVTDNFLLASKLFLKAVNSVDGDVRVSKRVYIPSTRLRGFESGKIGPIDGTQYIGGNYGAALNITSSFPKFFNEFENIDFNLFVDAANLWHVDYDKSLDADEIRSSTGIAVDWFTAIGPLSFSYAFPITDASTDKTESFRFQIGTSF
ncbi:MAG: outer membrane protein assembly factor BamA [Candidatus Pelagibacter sp.]